MATSGKFVNVKLVKITSLAALEVAKYLKKRSNMHETLKNRTYLAKIYIYFNFLGANFLVPKSTQ